MHTNANDEPLDQGTAPNKDGKVPLTQAVERLKLSTRSYHRVIRVARALGHLNGNDRVG